MYIHIIYIIIIVILILNISLSTGNYLTVIAFFSVSVTQPYTKIVSIPINDLVAVKKNSSERNKSVEEQSMKHFNLCLMCARSQDLHMVRSIWPVCYECTE